MATRIVVFDMDGTLVQARSAAWELFQETAERFELPIRSAEDFFALFEDNFFRSLDTVCGDPALGTQVREHFMAALQERYTPRLIPGMTDVVKRLAPHYALAVMSSNAMRAIRRTLEIAEVATCFAHVFSADLESSKRLQLGLLAGDRSYANVRRCSESYLEEDPAAGEGEVVLVTDTVGDVAEGVAAGARVIGVSWGMHGAQRLTEAGASFVARWPQELLSELLPAGSCRPGGCSCEQGTCTTTGSCGLRSTVPRAPAAEVAAIRLTRRRALGRVGALAGVATSDPGRPAPPVPAPDGTSPSSPTSTTRSTRASTRPADRLSTAIARISAPPEAPRSH